METPVGDWRLTWQEGAGLGKSIKLVPEIKQPVWLCKQGLCREMAVAEILLYLETASKELRTCRELRPRMWRVFLYTPWAQSYSYSQRFVFFLF